MHDRALPAAVVVRRPVSGLARRPRARDVHGPDNSIACRIICLSLAERIWKFLDHRPSCLLSGLLESERCSNNACGDERNSIFHEYGNRSIDEDEQVAAHR